MDTPMRRAGARLPDLPDGILTLTVPMKEQKHSAHRITIT